MKKREIRYDYLRCLAVFAIVAVHSIPTEPSNSFEWWFIAGVVPVLLSFVGIYFMLSGLFLLRSETEKLSSFYWNRIRAVAVPFLFYSLVYFIYDAVKNPTGRGLLGQAAVFIKELLAGTVPMAEHMWFLYVLMALYLCTPFLARMLNHMTDQELRVFLVIMVGVQGVSTYLPALGIQLGGTFDYVLFTGWTIYYILGYALNRLCRKEQRKFFLALGAAGFLITLIQKKFTPGFTPGIHDLALTMIVMASAIFLVFSFMEEGQSRWIKRIAAFVSRHSYSVYLIHYLVLHGFMGRTAAPILARGYFLTGILVTAGGTFLISLAAAFVLDSFLLFPLQRWMRRDRQQSEMQQSERLGNKDGQ